MRYLHLMPMDSSINVDLVYQINSSFPQEQHEFVFETERAEIVGISNCYVNPDCFSVDFINIYYPKYDLIFLHSLFYSPNELLEIDRNATSKMIWCVWGHDLYYVSRHRHLSTYDHIQEFIHFIKKIVRMTYLRSYLKQIQVKQVVQSFRCILIGYPFDRVAIHKKFGRKVHVEIAPYFSSFDKSDMYELLCNQSKSKHSGLNILIGHCGFHFIEHEKYLLKLAKYRDQDIRIHMVLSYGATGEEAQHIREVAYSLFKEDQINIVNKMMTKEAYHNFLSTMDIAIFPYKHQSGVFNTVLLSYLGKKLYFACDGVLYKGFRELNLPVYNCHDIGKIDYNEFSRINELPDLASPMYDIYNNSLNIQRWKDVFDKYS